MIRRWTILSCRAAPLTLLFLLYIVRTSDASDAKSFFAYIKEIAEPSDTPLVGANGREQRQSGPLTITFSLNGISNFTFNVAQIPTNFPIACGGDDRNYCNYPDLPLVETYDLNYYSRRPIPSGRCPDGYTKMPTFDCLNIAPALFETTCCMFMGTSVSSVCDATAAIDAMWTLCNGSVYIASGAYAYRFDQNFNFQQGPILLAALTGGCISRDLSEAEVDGSCNVQFFNLNDQYYTVDYATGSLSCNGPFLDSNLGLTGTPGLVFGAGRGNNIYKIDGDGFQVSVGSGFLFQCGGNTSASANVLPPGLIGQSPLQNCTAATYLPARDVICFICNFGANYLTCVTRAGVLVSANQTLTSIFSNCGATTTSSTSSQVAPLVYIPYPIYPVFMGQQASSPTSSSYGSSSYSSPTSSSYGSSPSSSSYGASPSASAPASMTSYGSSPSSSSYSMGSSPAAVVSSGYSG